MTANVPHGQGGECAALQDAEERAGQILEHLRLGAQSERFLMATELGMLMWKRERHAARAALVEHADELDRDPETIVRAGTIADWLRARAKEYE